LSPAGAEQALEIARSLAQAHGRFDAIYSSPMRRAIGTARPVAELLGCEIVELADLSEGSLGSWHGLELHAVDWSQLEIDPSFAPHGGESPAALALRSSRAPGDRGRSSEWDRSGGVARRND
jgi:broad specificity phosphatase PhoE